MKFIKNHKILLIFSLVFLIIFIMGSLLLILLISGNGKDTYGNRLDGIEEVIIKEDNLKKLNDKLNDLELVDKVTSHVQGKIVNVIFTVDDTLDLNTAKDYATLILDNFSKEEIEYYDYQIFFESNKEDSEKYPIIGYKNKINSEIAWKK